MNTIDKRVSKLRAHLIRCDGKSINGKVKQDGAELKRIADSAEMHPRSVYQIAEGYRATTESSWKLITLALAGTTEA